MTKIKDRVRVLLEAHPSLRDDDTRLYATYIAYEKGGLDFLKNLSAIDLLREISSGKITHFESVRRVRCKIQEKEPSLRGTKYKQRKEDGTRTTKIINDL